MTAPSDMRTGLSHEALCALLSYDFEAGRFSWLVDRTGGTKAGDEAGCVLPDGYRSVRVLGRNYHEHRLAWFYCFGDWPRQQIDHIDGDKQNNRICNLRDAPVVVNAQNLRRGHVDSKSGLLGVTWNSVRSMWRAMINVNGRQRFIGETSCKYAAHEAYLCAKKGLHAGCTL